MSIAELYRKALDACHQMHPEGQESAIATVRLGIALNVALPKEMSKQIAAENAVLYMEALVQLAGYRAAWKAAERDLQELQRVARTFVEHQDTLAQGDLAHDKLDALRKALNQ